MVDVRNLAGPMRVPFLILAPACVVLGVGTAAWAGELPRALDIVLVIVGGLAAHVSVNAFNEYQDFRSGLDERTVRTPFSGGSGTLQAKPHLARQALATAVVAMVATAAIGIYFVALRGTALIPVGLLGLVVIVAYTPLLAHNTALCLIAPGLGFGTCMVVGTHVALTGTYAPSAIAASMVPFFLVNDLLLLNQFPDLDADRSVGRRNVVIALGPRRAAHVYGAFLALAYVSLLFAVAAQILPTLALLGLLSAPLAARAAVGSVHHAEDIPALIPHLGLNVVVNIATPALIAVGLFLS